MRDLEIVEGWLKQAGIDRVKPRNNGFLESIDRTDDRILKETIIDDTHQRTVAHVRDIERRMKRKFRKDGQNGDFYYDYLLPAVQRAIGGSEEGCDDIISEARGEKLEESQLREGTLDLASEFGLEPRIAREYEDIASASSSVQDFAENVYEANEDEDYDLFQEIGIPYAELKQVWNFIQNSRD